MSTRTLKDHISLSHQLPAITLDVPLWVPFGYFGALRTLTIRKGVVSPVTHVLSVGTVIIVAYLMVLLGGVHGGVDVHGLCGVSGTLRRLLTWWTLWGPSGSLRAGFLLEP